MSLFETPRGVKTRSQLRALSTKNLENVENNGLNTDTARKKEPTPSDGLSRSNVSSSAARKQLEYEAAKAKAHLEIVEAEADVKKLQARLQKELIDKKIAAELAEIDDTRKSTISSYKSKVNDWLNKSATMEKCVKSYADDVQNKMAAPAPLPELSAEFARQPDHVPDQLREMSEMEKFAKVLRELIEPKISKRSPNSDLLTRLATSKDLPLYFGDPLEWLHFKEAFYESTRLCNYTDTENVWRLRKCLRGEAKEAVSALLIGSTTPQMIIDTLELRFGNPNRIIQTISAQLKKLPPLPSSYQNDIISFAIKVKNFVAATKAINRPEYLAAPELLCTLLAKLPATLISKWSDHVYLLKESMEVPNLQLLSEFLYHEAEKATSSGITHIYSQLEAKRKQEFSKLVPQHKIFHVGDGTSSSSLCKYCHKDVHCLEKCAKFKRALRKDRWRFARTRKLCYKCLCAVHEDPESCPAGACDVDGCGQPHHRLLHWSRPSAASPSAPVMELNTEDTEEKRIECVNQNSVQCNKALLKIVAVTLYGPTGSTHVHAILDSGSTVTLLSSDVADKVGLHGRNSTMHVRSAWDSSELTCQTEIVDFEIANCTGNRFSLRAQKMKELNLPSQRISLMDLSRYDYLCKINLNMCMCNDQPKLLIGQDNYHLMESLTCIKGKQGEPYVTETPLGWCVHGALHHRVSDLVCTSIPLSVNLTSYNLNLCNIDNCNTLLCDTESNISADVDLQDFVRRSFSLDSIGINNRPRQNLDELRAINIVSDTAKLVDGHWVVGLPWKYDTRCMPNSYLTAMNRLISVEKKMSRDARYASRYCDRVQHLLLNNYARKLSENEKPQRVWYLPHFGVDNPNKNKLRLVFDAACKSSGCCLNDFLLQVPDLLGNLYGIMFRFREYPVGVMGDIKDMFLRIKIREEDQSALRFLWREPNKSVGEYAMTSLIFGANCSPFIAQYINQNKNALRFKDELPDAVRAIQSNQYMDDYIDSFESEKLASQMIRHISFIHKQGDFIMCNWMSNRPDVLRDMPKETLSVKAIKFDLGKQPERALGLLWFPLEDAFGFDVSLKRIPNDIIDLKRKPTKRELLRIVMSIYDVHGFLNPFTIKAKLIIQETWKLSIKWDEEIFEELYISFCKWITQLRSLENIRIPRWYFCDRRREDTRALPNDKTASLQLHLFCDASPRAYATVAYFRKQNSDGTVQVCFIASKCRLAPIKMVSVPRLELQAALLACRLSESITREHRLQPDGIYYWCDSMVVLHWIRNQNKTYKTFIANRLGEIDELSKIHDWNYIPTKLNIADLATKDNEYDLSSDSEWFSGPLFLREPCTNWPCEPVTKESISDDTLEIKHSVINVCENNLPVCVPDPRRFSSWLRLLRATATVLLFIEKCRKRKNINELNDNLLKKAEILLIKYSQLESFKEEILLIKQGLPISKCSRLRTLTPFLSGDGILKVGGRIDVAVDVNLEMKTPVILDGSDHTTRLIVKAYHERSAHSFNELVVNELRQKYWILKLRPTVRSVAAKCLICRMRKAKPVPPRLGDLPIGRLNHHQRPFTNCGVDLFGPIEVVSGRQRVKRYGVLFTCLTVRAVHIELAASLTADSLIMALRRMSARRGWPHVMFSDNGTNMRGADTELKKSFLEIDREALISGALNRGVEWKFIPPASPHMGGAWERLIRSVKTTLRVVLKERVPKEETLVTLLAEVENIVNSRPLTHVSVEPKSQEALTPNHFLIGGSSNLPIPGTFDDSDLYLRKQWRVAQRLADMFWSRWVKEVLPTLLPRKKWHQEGAQLRVGDLVVIVDPNMPRNTWPKGLIETVYPGADGRVRVVDVQTSYGVLKRSVTRVALLYRDNYECRDDDTRGEDVKDA